MKNHIFSIDVFAIKAKTLRSCIAVLTLFLHGIPSGVHAAQDFRWICSSGEFGDHNCWSGSNELPQSVDTVKMGDPDLFDTVYDNVYMDIVERDLWRVENFRVYTDSANQNMRVRQFSNLRVAEDMSLGLGEGGDVDWYIHFNNPDITELEVGDRLYIKSTVRDTTLSNSRYKGDSYDFKLTADRIRVLANRGALNNTALLHVNGQLLTNELNISGTNYFSFSGFSTQVYHYISGPVYNGLGASSIGSMIIAEDDDEAGIFTLDAFDSDSTSRYAGELEIGDVQVGRFGEGVFDQRGGIIHGKDSSSKIVLGNGTGSHGTYYLKNGEINLSTGSVSSVDVGNYGLGEFIQTGGAHHSSNVVVTRESAASGSFYQLGGGSLDIDSLLIVGLRGQGAFNQNGGNVNTHILSIASQAGSDGSVYNLNGADVSLDDLNSFPPPPVDLRSNLLSIGEGGTGSFVQDGGINVTTTLTLYNGSYDLLAGVFSVGAIANRSGAGTVNIDGGTLNLNSDADIDTLNIASRTGSTGDFTTRRDLQLGSLTVGANGVGAMTQRDDVNVAGTMRVGYYTPGVGGHAYYLEGGDLVSNELVIGHIVEDATFTQNGGTNITTNMTVGNYASAGNVTYVQNDGETTVTNQLGLGFRNTIGVYTLNGGTLDVGFIWNGSGTSVLSLNGGTLNINGGFANADILTLGSSSSSGHFSLEAGKSMTTEYAFIQNGTYTQNGGTFTTDILSMGTLLGKTASYDLRGGTLNAKTLSNGSGEAHLYMNGGTLDLPVMDIDVDVFKVASEASMETMFILFAGESVEARDIETGVGGEFRNDGSVSYSVQFSNKGTFHNSFGGMLTNNGMLNNSGTLTNNFDAELRNKVGATITNTGQMKNTFNGSFVNDGDIDNEADFTNENGGKLTNNGVINNSGIVRLDPNSVTQGTGRFHQTAGELIVNSTMIQDSVEIAGGVLSGYGTIVSDVSLAGGLLGPGNSPNTLSIDGDFTMDEFSGILFELGGTLPGYLGYDVLSISSSATLTGELEVVFYDLGNGLFNASLGDSFDLLSAETINGAFGITSFASLDNGLDWRLDYLNDEIGSLDVVRLSVVEAVVPVPAGMWLLGSGLIGLVGMARRR